VPHFKHNTKWGERVNLMTFMTPLPLDWERLANAPH
jgi:hypothetical protein